MSAGQHPQAATTAGDQRPYTPGPWRIERDRSVIRIWAEDDFIGIYTADGARREANACLAAAAPDLFEALERLLDAANHGTVDISDLNLAFAALAAARGER